MLRPPATSQVARPDILVGAGHLLRRSGRSQTSLAPRERHSPAVMEMKADLKREHGRNLVQQNPHQSSCCCVPRTKQQSFGGGVSSPIFEEVALTTNPSSTTKLTRIDSFLPNGLATGLQVQIPWDSWLIGPQSLPAIEA